MLLQLFPALHKELHRHCHLYLLRYTHRHRLRHLDLQSVTKPLMPPQLRQLRRQQKSFH